jgi:hypothetical protein
MASGQASRRTRSLWWGHSLGLEMAYHVEIRRSFHRAWAFNLDEAALASAILDRWRRGLVVELGDREWEPRACRITVLEGPALQAHELGKGQGWQNAQRTATDVTSVVLAGAATGPPTAAGQVAVIATDADAGGEAQELLAQLGLATIDWLAVRGRLVQAASSRPGPPAAAAGLTAALLVIGDQPPDGAWLFDAGLAVATLGAGAILAIMGAGEAPPALSGVGVVRLDLAHPPSRAAVAARLRQAGCAVEADPASA